MTTVTTIGAEPARIDIDVNAGEEVDFTVPVFDGDGAARDVTGWTITARARVPRSSTALYTFAPTGGVDGVRVAASGAVTALWADWPVASARWDLWITPPGGEPDLFASGWVRVTH